MRSFLLAVFLLCLCSGCASWGNDIAADGGIFGTYKGDYVVISESGGEIMDVWVLEDVFCESESGSDGWRFKDGNDNITFIGGDVKVIRAKDKSILRGYREYHRELEKAPYTPPSNDLTGRYHRRGRTDGFFRRGRRVCARYHLRNRTNDFFGRVA